VNVEAIYATLCRAADPAGALHRMSDSTLAALITDLAAAGMTSGVPALIAAMGDAEAATRWLEDHAPQGGAVGEGSI
jgi:hypothetical protein